LRLSWRLLLMILKKIKR